MYRLILCQKSIPEVFLARWACWHWYGTRCHVWEQHIDDTASIALLTFSFTLLACLWMSMSLTHVCFLFFFPRFRPRWVLSLSHHSLSVLKYSCFKSPCFIVAQTKEKNNVFLDYEAYVAFTETLYKYLGSYGTESRKGLFFFFFFFSCGHKLLSCVCSKIIILCTQ